MNQKYSTTIFLTIAIILLTPDASALMSPASLVSTSRYVYTAWAEVCGDGIKAGEEECDDNNRRSGDGCSDACLIEDRFACSVSDVTTTSSCYECLGNTYQAANKTVCLPCDQLCATCDSSSSCLSCFPNSKRYLDVETNRCLLLPGYFEDGSSVHASACDSSCLTCSGAGRGSCLSCASDRVLVSKVCVLCSELAGPFCVACSRSDEIVECTACVNSTLKDGSCVAEVSSVRILAEISQPAKNGLWMILLPSFYGGFLLLKSCLIVFCIWKRGKNRKNRVQEGQNVAQNESFENVENRYVQPARVENYSDSNVVSDSAEDSRSKNLNRNQQEPNRIKIKSGKKRTSLVVHQKEAYNDGYQVLQNVRELNIPSKNSRNNKLNKQQSNQSGESYNTVQTKRKMLSKGRINGQSDDSEVSEQGKNKKRKTKRRHEQNLVYFQNQD